MTKTLHIVLQKHDKCLTTFTYLALFTIVTIHAHEKKKTNSTSWKCKRRWVVLHSKNHISNKSTYHTYTHYVIKSTQKNRECIFGILGCVFKWRNQPFSPTNESLLSNTLKSAGLFFLGSKFSLCSIRRFWSGPQYMWTIPFCWITIFWQLFFYLGHSLCTSIDLVSFFQPE